MKESMIKNEHQTMNQPSISKTALAEAVRDMVGGDTALNYFTYISEELGFIYFSVPGVANFRTVGSLNLAVAETLELEYTLSKMTQIFNRNQRIIKSPEQEGFDIFDHMLEDVDVMKLMFVRDPAERFAINYRNSLSINTKQSVPREKLFGYLGISVEENLSMLDLAELLCEEQEIKTLIPQLRSQRQMTAFDLVDYSFVGHHNNWEEDYKRIAQETFGYETPIFDPIRTFNKDPEGTAFNVQVDQDTKAALAEAYREDYEMIDEIKETFPTGFQAGHA